MNDFTLKKQEQEQRVKEAEAQQDEHRRIMAQQQLEQQKMYKVEMKNSYKNILDGQVS